jgi:manganese/zinc/iron transport system ATP- binding protein
MIVQVENPVLEVHDLTVSYDKNPVLWNVDFSIPKGKLVGIIGPNGAGKSTMLKSVMGLVDKQSGYVKVFDKDVDDVREQISYVPQRESVDWDFPASVLDVVLMGRYGRRGLFKRTTKEDKQIAMDSLAKVNMQDYAKRQIAQLSGGQQQRVFIARSLAQQANLYLMDEPFAGVDASAESSILNLLQEMRAEEKTIMVVHHDLQSAYEYFDWVILLNMRLVASGPKEEVFTTELLQETYGGKLTLLDSLSNFIRQKEFPIKG